MPTCATLLAEWRAAMRPEFLWERMNDPNVTRTTRTTERSVSVIPFNVTWVANRVSCDQDIAADGFFSLGMIARLESSLRERGEWFYRRLFWETGILGQVRTRGGSGRRARDRHRLLLRRSRPRGRGLSGKEWQSLPLLDGCAPVDDGRLTTETGYEWESSFRLKAEATQFRYRTLIGISV